MSPKFAAVEVLEMGIQVEKNGFDFYCALAKQTEKEEAKIIFNFLAKEEEKHIIIFKKMLSNIENEPNRQSLSEEYFAYMNALAGEDVFTQKDKARDLAKTLTTDTEAVDLGIKMEKNSLVFYQGIKKMVLPEDRHVVDELLRQEEGHLMKLYNLKKQLSIF